MSKATHVYLGRQACGCAVAFVVDDPDDPKFTAREIAKWVRRGRTVERVLLDEARSGPFGCKCPKAPEPPPAQQAFTLSGP
jgi:hypothetical protein